MCGCVFGFAWGDLVALRTWTLDIFSVRICVCKRMRAACAQLIEIVLLCFAYKYSYLVRFVLLWAVCCDVWIYFWSLCWFYF